jgi:hypothetical protein
MPEDNTAAEDAVGSLLDHAHRVGKQHAFRERFRAFIELYIQHADADELHRIIKEKDIKLSIAGEMADLFHPSIDAEIQRRHKEFTAWADSHMEEEDA